MKKLAIFSFILVFLTVNVQVTLAESTWSNSKIETIQSETEKKDVEEKSFWSKYKYWIIGGAAVATTAGITWYLLEKEQPEKDESDEMDMEKLKKEMQQRIQEANKEVELQQSQSQQLIETVEPEQKKSTVQEIKQPEKSEQTIEKSETEKTKFYNLTVWKDVQVYDKTYSVKGIRFNVSFGENENVQGLDFGFPVPVNYVNGNMKGVELGIFNKIGGNVKGLQAGIYNNVSGDFTGWQFGGVNIVDNHFLGLQSGVYNQTNTMEGVQFGFVNNTQKLNGVQIGIINVNHSGNKWVKYPLFMCPLVNVAF